VLFNKEQVKNFIPHRDPFLFIDSIESMNLDGWTYGNKVLSSSDAVGGVINANFYTDEKMDLFKGHFPGKPIFPGVIQIEAMAQASSFVMAFFINNPFEIDTLDIALARVEETRFRMPVLPNKHLKIQAKIVRYRSPIIVTECKIFDGDNVVSEAKLSASIKM
jgi:3-hydroxyacyl-[acyl-carrier-protein] dehydratase